MWFVIKHEDRIIIKLSSKVNSLAFLQASTSTITTNCTNDDSADCAQYSKELEVLVCHHKSHEKRMGKSIYLNLLISRLGDGIGLNRPSTLIVSEWLVEL